jgi:glycosyltransferase involved in cell wall biosynthesis
MRVLVDARPAVTWDKTGVGFYAWHLLRLLPAVDPSTTYVAWYLSATAAFRPWRRHRFFPDVPRLRERWTPIPATWFERLSQRYELPRIEWFHRFDVLWAPNFVPPPTARSRVVLTVHDLAFRLHPHTAPMATRRWLERFDRALGGAAHVIAVSGRTRDDLLNLYEVDPARVSVVPLGVDHRTYRPPHPQAVEAVRRRFGIDGPYLLSLGGIEPRKNLPGILAAFASLGDGSWPSLVIAGSSVAWNPEGRRLLDAALEVLPPAARRRVVITGYVPEEVKPALIGGAEALVYPSMYEGFGLPVIEAMACGTPVLTSDRSALPETAGGAAMLVDPTDALAIADGIRKLLEDEALRQRLRAAGERRAEAFSWTEAARRTAEVLALAARR